MTLTAMPLLDAGALPPCAALPRYALAFLTMAWTCGLVTGATGSHRGGCRCIQSLGANEGLFERAGTPCSRAAAVAAADVGVSCSPIMHHVRVPSASPRLPPMYLLILLRCCRPSWWYPPPVWPRPWGWGVYRPWPGGWGPGRPWPGAWWPGHRCAGSAHVKHDLPTSHPE